MSLLVSLSVRLLWSKQYTKQWWVEMSEMFTTRSHCCSNKCKYGSAYINSLSNHQLPFGSLVLLAAFPNIIILHLLNAFVFGNENTPA